MSFYFMIMWSNVFMCFLLDLFFWALPYFKFGVLFWYLDWVLVYFKLDDILSFRTVILVFLGGLQLIEAAPCTTCKGAVEGW